MLHESYRERSLVLKVVERVCFWISHHPTSRQTVQKCMAVAVVQLGLGSRRKRPPNKSL